MLTPEQFNSRGTEWLPGLLGIVATLVDKSELPAELQAMQPPVAFRAIEHSRD